MLGVQEEYENEQEHWKGQLDATLLKLNVEAHERTAAVALAAEQQQELEQKLWEVRGFVTKCVGVWVADLLLC